MRNKTTHLFIFFIFLFGNSYQIFSQDQTEKCYAKALMPDEYETVTEQVLIRTPICRIEKIPYNKEERITKVPIPNTDPVEYTYQRDSIVPAPFNSRTIIIPAEYKTVSKKRIKKKGGYYAKVEVICEKDLTKEKFNLIKNALTESGFPIGRSSSFRKSLEDYQKNNNLPIGQIDLKTLEHMGIE